MRPEEFRNIGEKRRYVSVQLLLRPWWNCWGHRNAVWSLRVTAENQLIFIEVAFDVNDFRQWSNEGSRSERSGSYGGLANPPNEVRKLVFVYSGKLHSKAGLTHTRNCHVRNFSPSRCGPSIRNGRMKWRSGGERFPSRGRNKSCFETRYDTN